MMTGCNDDDDNNNAVPPPPSEGVELENNQVAIYYQRADGDYQNWGLHLWDLHLWDNDSSDNLAAGVATGWDAPKMADGIDDTFGAYYIINLNEDRQTGQTFSLVQIDRVSP